MRKVFFIYFVCLLFFSSTVLALDPPDNLHISDGEDYSSSTVDDSSSSTVSASSVDWNFSVPRGASRTSGVAPLSVHFSAGLTESSADAQPFHNYEYSWTFGDSDSGIWGTSGKSKNTDKGPVAAHLYETPGTYTATLTVRDSSGIVDTDTFTVTVQDPDVVFAGTKTTCISTNSDFTGCPDGANQVTTSDLSVLSSYTDAGERVLLRRGSSWTVSSSIAFPNNAGPVHIGAYGTSSNPDELGICENAPLVTVTGGSSFLSMSKKQDWRLADISFSAAEDIGAVTSGSMVMKRNLVLRVESTGFSSSISFSNWRLDDDSYVEDIAVYSSRLTDANDYNLYIGSERLVVMGNIIQNTDEQHALRIWQAYQGLISHNMVSGASRSKQALKIHGPAPPEGPGGALVGNFADTGYSGLRNYTQFVVVSNNVFGSSGPWTLAIAPQNEVYAEQVSDVLFEKNKIVTEYGQQNESAVTQSGYFAGRYFSVRNNIIDGSGGSTGGYSGMVFTRGGVTWEPLGNRIYNNTIYNRSSLDYARGIKIDSSYTGDIIIRNNYVSLPNTTGSKEVVTDNSNVSTASNNVLTNIPYFVDPDNTSVLDRDFQLTSSAVLAIDQGVSVPVFDDFLGESRTSPYDIGAFSY